MTLPTGMRLSNLVAVGIATVIALSAFRLQPSDLGAANFDDGTFGPFVVDPIGAVRIADDPSNSGRGKVAELTFQSDSLTPHPKAALKLAPAARHLGFGSTIYFSGEILIPASTFNLRNPSVRRTLVHFRAPLDLAPSDSTDSFVMLEHTGACELRIEWSHDGWWKGSDCRLAPFEAGRWHKIEMRVTMNSAANRSDGKLQMWVNGKLAFDETTVRLTNPARKGNPFWQILSVGSARYRAEVRGGFDLSEGNVIRELRYWDNLSFRTDRLASR